MSKIVYVVVARGGQVLVQYCNGALFKKANAGCSQDLAHVTRVLLSKLTSANGTKLSYSFERVMFHFIMRRTVTYICITGDTDGGGGGGGGTHYSSMNDRDGDTLRRTTTARAHAYGMLNDVIDECDDDIQACVDDALNRISLTSSPASQGVVSMVDGHADGGSIQSPTSLHAALADNDAASSSSSPSSAASSSLSNLTLPPHVHDAVLRTVTQRVQRHNKRAPPRDTVAALEAELDSVKGIMIENIDKIIARSDHLDVLIEKTETMNDNAVTFQRASKKLRKQMCRGLWMYYVLLFLFVAGLAYAIAAIECGMDFSEC